MAGSLSDYNTAIQTDPNYAEAYMARGILKALKLGDSQGGLEDLDRLIEIDPSQTNYTLRGYTKLALKDNYGAIADLRQVGRIYERKGDTKGYLEVQESIKGIEAIIKLGA